jgi:sec-independent protein translocase protein TatA
MFSDLFDSPWKILIVAIVIIVLFGSRKLPAAARSLGQSMRILKTEVQGLHEDEPTSTASSTSSVETAPAQLGPTPSVTAAQAQIDALSQQIASLQQTVSASNVPVTNNVTDSAQAN